MINVLAVELHNFCAKERLFSIIATPILEFINAPSLNKFQNDSKSVIFAFILLTRALHVCKQCVVYKVLLLDKFLQAPLQATWLVLKTV
jgi:hypothetical protein